jgi:cell wall-associated NlpC family hydrolase
MREVFHAMQVPGKVTETPAEAPKEGRIRGMLKRALGLLGTPYRWGGTNPESGFDCSGLVGYVFRNSLGIELPRISRDMANVGELIRDREELAEGDLVFFSRRGKYVDHVGIYIGNGQFVHSPRTGKTVEVASLATGYWSQKFLKARRVAAQQ